MMKGMRINCCCGYNIEPTIVLSVSPYLHYLMAGEMPSEDIRKNQKEMFGFEWSEYKRGE